MAYKKATPITYKASALKQTFNPGLIEGAGKSAPKFQDYSIPLTDDAKSEKSKAATDNGVQEKETDDNTNNSGGSGDNTGNGGNDTGSGSGGGDGVDTAQAAEAAQQAQEDLLNNVGTGV
tara:strand:+ start:134 stop:493 length:360 start_codon:yes stop_codon:yes gene_type:complete